MLKKKSLINKFNKLLISRIELIESHFNKLKSLINFKKKKKINLKKIDKKIFISIGSFFILIISYFLIPTFYDENIVKIKLEKQIQDKYNLDVKFNDNLSYRIFPKPHFVIKNAIFIYDEKNLAKSDFSKIYISFKNFFSTENIKIKEIFFKQTEFNINANNVYFFKEILNANKTEHAVNFKNSILFYKNKNEDVIFFISINNLNFFYNENLSQQLYAKLKIFNIPFKLNVENNLETKSATVNLNSRKLRFKVNNNFNYDDKNASGLIDFQIINKSKIFNFDVNNESISFDSNDNNFKGEIDFKPFYMLSSLKFNQVDIEKIFEENSVLLNLINSEILNNQNLNAQVTFHLDKIKGVNNIKNIVLKTYFEEGNIVIKDSILNWKNSVLINLDEIQLISENNNLVLAGGISFDFNNIDNFYSQYQIKRKHRKKIKKIRFDFLLNVYENEIQIENLKIDGAISEKVNKFLNKFNYQKKDIFNKVLLRNSIKEFFANYYEG